MTARCTTTALAGLAVFALAVADGAHAHEVRFVASNGSNANLCTRDAPCVTLQRGIRHTPSGGELIILDSGDYGNSATIDKSITISAVGVSATLGGTITIDAADATVVLRGLRLNGAGTDGAGIYATAAAAVYIEGCEIQNFFGPGISVSTSGDTKLFVSDSVSRNNGDDGLLYSGMGRVTIDNSRFERNGDDGVDIRFGEAAITRTIASGNTGHGIVQANGGKTNVTWTTAEHNGEDGYSVGGVGVSSEITLDRSVARGNATGVRVAGSSIARISSSVVTNNGTGLSVEAGSTLLTRVNNAVSGNTTDISGTVTPLGGI